MKISYIIMFSCLYAGHLFAQTNPYIPTIVPPSPEAAALFKFTDVPVSPYTGTTDVSVPIYTIQARGVSMPISMDYHTGGIRVKEESGYVGLGWALNAGGCISRTVMDKDDFNGSAYFTATVPQLSGDLSTAQPLQAIDTTSHSQQTGFLGIYIADFFCNDLENFTTGQADYTAVFTTTGPSTYDLEPDIFSYSFAGRSGKFIITRDRRVILQKQDNIKIQFESNGNSFTITDEEGNVFYFYDKAFIQSAALASSPISSWNLSKVITQKKDSILFTYYTDPVAEYVQPDYTEIATYFSGSDGHEIVNGAGTSYGNELLQTIDFSSGRLQFYYGNNRSDLQGGKKLDSVRIFSKNNAALQYARQYNFFYTYFNNSVSAADSFETKRLKLDSVKEISGTLSIPPYAFLYNIPTGNTLNKHGYSADHWGFYNAAPNSGSIPSLGLYYNPPNSEFREGLALPQFFSYTGANREVSFPYNTAFSLLQVKYPTGGKTVLEYEPNDYDALASQNGPVSFLYPTTVVVQKQIYSAKPGDTTGTIDLSRIYPSLPANYSQSNLTILVTFRASDNLALQRCMQNSAASFSFNGKDANSTESIVDGSVSGAVSTITMQVPIHAGSPMIYTWDCNISPSLGTDFQDIRVTFQYDTVQLAGEPVGVGNNYAKVGGGLRVKTITDYSDDNTIAKKRYYGYNYSAAVGGVTGYYSYGKLMYHPSYARYQVTPTSTGGFTNALALSGSSYTPLTSGISGNIIGYSQVTESTIDPVTNADIGKTVYTYFNSPDSAINYKGFDFPGILTIGNNLNGLMLSKTEYVHAGTVYKPVSVVSHSYHTANRTIYFSPKYQPTGQTGASFGGTGCVIGTGVDEQILCFYPSIKSEKVLMDKEVETLYDQNILTQTVTVPKQYYYDNLLHYLPTRISTFDSKGDAVVKLTRYPQDYIPTGSQVTGNTLLDSMIGRNIVAEPIEERDSLYYPGSTSGIITGARHSSYRLLPNNMFDKDKLYRLDISSPVTDFQPFAINLNTISQDSRYRQMLSFDRYDPSSNISQYTTYNKGPVTVLWDHARTYPIAKVENADSTSIAFTSFEADGSGNWTFTPGSIDASKGYTGSQSYVLSNNLSRSGLNSATTYIVSYWTTGAACTITGTLTGYPIHGRTVVVNGTSWTYYEHQVSGQTTVQVNGSGNVDEVRLYPLTARMVTYTYSPLIGMTGQCDENNRANYYTYDVLGRLRYVKDQNGNIVKTQEYHYQGQ